MLGPDFGVQVDFKTVCVSSPPGVNIELAAVKMQLTEALNKIEQLEPQLKLKHPPQKQEVFKGASFPFNLFRHFITNLHPCKRDKVRVFVANLGRKVVGDLPKMKTLDQIKTYWLSLVNRLETLVDAAMFMPLMNVIAEQAFALTSGVLAVGPLSLV